MDHARLTIFWSTRPTVNVGPGEDRLDPEHIGILLASLMRALGVEVDCRVLAEAHTELVQDYEEGLQGCCRQYTA